MPLTVRIQNPELERRLLVLTAEYNQRNGTALSLAAWLLAQIRKLATQRELAAAAQWIAEDERAKADAAMAAALQAEEERLLGLVS